MALSGSGQPIGSSCRGSWRVVPRRPARAAASPWRA